MPYRSPPPADSIITLVGEDILATIDGRTATTTSLVKIDGVGRVLGIDVRPADGQLYALSGEGTIAIIDPATGKATAKSKGGEGNHIDAKLGALFRQAPPNDGVLNTIGMIGVNVDRIGFDIVADGAGTNAGVLIANGRLFRVDLATGKAEGGKTIAGLPSDVRDVAVLLSPTPSRPRM